MRQASQVLVRGGGGGLGLAIRLARATGRGRRARVTVVDPKPSHIWKPRLHEIAIVGAGTTGVELAAELRNATSRLAQYRSLIDPARVDLTVLEMADRPLPGVATYTSDYARRLLDEKRVATRFRARVVDVEPGTLRLADGDTVEADILVWASGVRGRGGRHHSGTPR